MSISDKLIKVFNNIQKVYNTGKAAGASEADNRTHYYILFKTDVGAGANITNIEVKSESGEVEISNIIDNEGWIKLAVGSRIAIKLSVFNFVEIRLSSEKLGLNLKLTKSGVYSDYFEVTDDVDDFVITITSTLSEYSLNGIWTFNKWLNHTNINENIEITNISFTSEGKNFDAIRFLTDTTNDNVYWWKLVYECVDDPENPYDMTVFRSDSGWFLGTGISSNPYRYKTITFTEETTVNSLFYKWFTKSAVEIPVDNSIDFVLGGSIYQADKDMTWKQWVESTYNTIGLYIHNSKVYHLDYGEVQYIGSSVIETQPIVDGNFYSYYKEATEEEIIAFKGTWVLDDYPDFGSLGYMYFNFKSNGEEYSYIRGELASDRLTHIGYYGQNSGEIKVCENAEAYGSAGYVTWTNNNHKTITITSDLPSVENGSMILAWLKKNATRATSAEKLVGTWVFNETIEPFNATESLINETVKFSSVTELTSVFYLNMQYLYEASGRCWHLYYGRYNTKSSVYSSNSGWVNNGSRTVTFESGQVVSSEFQDWLMNNASKVP